MKQPSLKVAIVGCGAIGRQLAKMIQQQRSTAIRLVALVDQAQGKAGDLAKSLRPRPQVMTLAQAVSAAELVIECAQMSAVPEIARAVLAKRKDCLVLSVGALIRWPELLREFSAKRCLLHFPSGAVAGLDALKAAAAIGSIQRVQLITRKPVAGLAGATSIRPTRQAQQVFKGNALAAVKKFPANINVAAAVSLVGIGPKRTQVQIMVDPAISRNTHTLTVEGKFGRFVAITENEPSAQNPKTSALAAASAFACLQSLVLGDHHGT